MSHASIRGAALVLSLVFSMTACGRLENLDRTEADPSVPDVARITCEADGTTSVATPEVIAQLDGVHLVVTNQLAEPASITGGFAGFDASPGVSDWILQIAPGDHGVACWPFSQHGTGDVPSAIPIEVLDPNGMYVPPTELECEGGQQWSSIYDYVDLSSGNATDPVDAVRDSVTNLGSNDVLTLARSGYPEADREGGATVVLRRDDRVAVIFGLTQAHDGGWLIAGAEGCGDVNVGI